MAVVTLKSGIPGLIATLGPRTDDAVEEAAEMIAEAARTRAPVLTGALKASIHVEEVGLGLLANGYAVVADATDEDGYPYGIAVEFGQHQGSHSVGPHAFMYPAFEEVGPELPDIVKGKIRGGA